MCNFLIAFELGKLFNVNELMRTKLMGEYVKLSKIFLKFRSFLCTFKGIFYIFPISGGGAVLNGAVPGLDSMVFYAAL